MCKLPAEVMLEISNKYFKIAFLKKKKKKESSMCLNEI